MRWKKWIHRLTLVSTISVAAVVPAADAQQPAFKVLYAERINLDTTLKVMLDFGTGVRHPFVVDTGSVGIVVPESELPRSVKKAAAGSIRYTSSGLVVEGFWTEPIDVKLDVSGAIAHVPVFAATSSTCVQPSSNSCNPGSLPRMMGIGFGRPESYASPDRNPLIQIANLPSGTPSNYRITHFGIDLGIVNAENIEGMHTMRLKNFTRHGLSEQSVTDYRTPTGTIRVNDGRRQHASILIDTGITDALIALDRGEPSGCLPLTPAPGVNCTVNDGTKFTVSMLDGAAKLSFVASDHTKTTPSSAHWIHLSRQEGNFINTGIRPLARFDIFYDYTNGLFGLSPARLY
jgi:hypothetical protein